jgi:hypothetical protein
MSLPFLRETLLYPQVIPDSRNPYGALYSLSEVPMTAIPINAWIGRTTPRPGAILRPPLDRRPQGVAAGLSPYEATLEQ